MSKINNSKKPEKRRSKARIIIILLTFLLVLIISIIAVTASTGWFFGKGIFGDGTVPIEQIERETASVTTEPVIASGEVFDGNINVNVPQVTQTAAITIPGYSSIVTDHAHGNIKLVNPEGNEVLFKYTISMGDKILYTSDYILPNNQIYWNVLNAVPDSGTYDLTFKIETIDSDTYAPCNGATQKVSLTIL